MELLYIERIQFVIRLNGRDRHRQPCLSDADGEPVKLFLKPGETIIRRKVYYLGTVKVNRFGYWRKSLSKPLWIMTSLQPERGLEIYQKRMKIEQTLKDGKDLLHLAKRMSKRQRYLKQMIAPVLIAYVIGLWCGEAIRDVVYGKLPVEKLKDNLFGNSPVDVGKYPKWLRFCLKLRIADLKIGIFCRIIGLSSSLVN